MISTNEFKTGLSLILDGQLYIIVEYQHVKPGKGGAFVRTKLKNLKLGTVLDRTFRAGEKIEEAFIEDRKYQFLYCSGQIYHFLDQETFEEVMVSKEEVGESNVKFLKEGMMITASLYKDKLVTISLPTFIELKVDQTEPGLRGDTAKGGTKLAKLETGAVIQVPLFINTGDIVKIDTRSGEYVERA
jgi:elongation factor P